MSVDYEMVCHKHKEKVSICSDGMSGPLLNCDRSLSAFCITHRHCDLNMIDEHQDQFADYEEWYLEDCIKRLSYSL